MDLATYRDLLNSAKSQSKCLVWLSLLSFTQIKKESQIPAVSHLRVYVSSRKIRNICISIPVSTLSREGKETQEYSSGLFYFKWSDLEWWEGNPNPIPTPTPSKTQIFAFCMILLEQHSSQWTLCYGLVCLKGTQGKMWILHLKIKVHLLTGTILAVRCEMNYMYSLFHNRVQICSLIFFIHSSENDSGAILLNCSAYHSDLLLLQPWVSPICILMYI